MNHDGHKTMHDPGGVTMRRGAFSLPVSFWLAVIIALIGLDLAAYLSLVVFMNHPYSQDEYSYLYQARIFAQGKLYTELPQTLRPLTELYMIWQDGKLYSKYPPAFSAVLALGVKLGIPGLVNPMLSGMTLMLMFLTLRTFMPPFPALATLFLLATNTYFLGYGGSYFAQPLALCLTALFFFLLRRYQLHPTKGRLIAAALAIAATMLVRPLDALCLGLTGALAIALFRWRSGELLKHWLIFAIVAGLGPLALFSYHYIASDCFCLATYPIWDMEFEVVKRKATGLMHNLQLIHQDYLKSLHEFVPMLFWDFTVPVIGVLFLVMAAIGAISWHNRYCLVGLFFILLIVLLYNFHHTRGWPQYGARYWYPALVPVTLMAGHGIALASARLPKSAVAALLAIMAAWQAYIFWTTIPEYRKRFMLHQSIYHTILHECGERSIVVLPHNKQWKARLPDFTGPRGLRRNAFREEPYLFVYQYRQAQRVAKQYPHYRICTYAPRR